MKGRRAAQSLPWHLPALFRVLAQLAMLQLDLCSRCHHPTLWRLFLKCPFLTTLCPQRQGRDGCRGQGTGKGRPGCVLPALHSLQAATDFTAPSKIQGILRFRVFFNPISRLSGAWGSALGSLLLARCGGRWVGAHLGAARVRTGLTPGLLFAGPWFGTGTTQLPMGSWRWLRLWRGKEGAAWSSWLAAIVQKSL